jgi:hypothetical protein
MPLSKISTTKPASFWQRVTLQINGPAYSVRRQSPLPNRLFVRFSWYV